MTHNILVRLLVLGAAAWPALAPAADRAWTLDQVSPGLQAVGRAVVVPFQPGKMDAPLPANARITRVYAARSYDGPARVATDLCWGSAQGPCVPLQGSHVNTRAFDGRSAQGPLLLVHRVENWGPASPPLFVRGTVTVWYAAGRP
ncbi:flagellar protein FlhE [uncultured Castellaniella sp.]|uniref:flagellar protein FlhE n=1 Tax=uncultured Castellaniella sp. TaxID=647907 RepID=UPI00260634BF|nr:flagellar protein FlhE [uncultured Castellaniella sp.]